ncbi:unnamed protein product [Notodromas monacha]|uniref:ceramide glucosyltransferase n=1 Tax=Notodromas monacha TaxID=399045 RepID=A0A7R9GET3_9CRUS|nr:unnamed protein product [Notodromas monacha]CAG0919975.1 unnamed protein product [Notodromas monacha]
MWTQDPPKKKHKTRPITQHDLLALGYARWRLHGAPRGARRSPEDPWPGVSILKPLVGVDCNLVSNLETFFTMNYPAYELLFCVAEETDPALVVCRALLDKYPKVDARIFVGGEKVGANPKINNMEPGYKTAKYDLVMISDSGLRMREDTLTDMVSHMGEKVGLVHQMPFVCDRDGFPSVLEKVYFGTCVARIYLAADLLGINSVTGMSCIFRKSIVDELGGLKAFGCYLAEDYFLGLGIQKKGFKLRVTSQPAWQNPGPSDIPSFQARIRRHVLYISRNDGFFSHDNNTFTYCRWTQLRIAMVPTTILLEPLQECVVLGLCTAWAGHALFHWDPLVFFLVHSLSTKDELMTEECRQLPLTEWKRFRLKDERTDKALKLRKAVKEVRIVDPVIRWRSGAYRLNWGGVIRETPVAVAQLSSPAPLGTKVALAVPKKRRPPSSACASYPTSSYGRPPLQPLDHGAPW